MEGMLDEIVRRCAAAGLPYSSLVLQIAVDVARARIVELEAHVTRCQELNTVEVERRRAAERDRDLAYGALDRVAVEMAKARA
jgi:hypothetical protein